MKKILLLLTICLGVNWCYAQNDNLWMRYPAISPDGKEIVFSYQGDLFKVPSSGGVATPITLHEGHDFMPVWSHDGKSIAFASNRKGNFDVYVMPAQGGPATRLTVHSSDDLPSDFSADNSQVLFSSVRTDLASSSQFPYGFLPELYTANVNGQGTPQIVSTFAADDARYNAKGDKIIFHDRKGYEDKWRKHHQSAITRDIWMMDPSSKKYTQLTKWGGEDRNALFKSDNEIVYLSERSGSFNVYSMPLDGQENPTALTTFTKHPVRFLTAANSGTLCFSFDGGIYTMQDGQSPVKVNIAFQNDGRSNASKTISINGNISEMAVSPNGKEVAYIVRGEVFVSSIEGGNTKRITNTAEQERSVSFHPDGKKILYASERNNNWDIYESSLTRSEEDYFYAATVLKETQIIGTSEEEFQPAYSPNGEEIAYLSERTEIKIKNIKSGAVRSVLGRKQNYSYSDGDQYFTWSPDSKWLLATMIEHNWISDIGLIKADGSEKYINLTKSGYNDAIPIWAKGGEMMVWGSDRDGQKNHGSWGGEYDIYGMFFTQAAYDEFKLSKSDYELWKEKKKEEKKDDKDKDKDKEDNKTADIVIEKKGLEARKTRLTIHSSDLAAAVLSKDGQKLYYLSRVADGFDIWEANIRTRSTKVLSHIGSNANGMVLDKKGENLFVQASGRIHKIKTSDGSKKTIGINGEMQLKLSEERAYIFDHSWRQVVKKFYREDLHGVDWDMYGKSYKRFLPSINNNYDFAELLSELLGELNASHTGCRYRPRVSMGDATASLGVFYDENHKSDGLEIEEVMEGGPLDNADSKVKKGTIIEKINGVKITTATNVNTLLNRQIGKNMLLSLYDKTSSKRWEEVIKPISTGAEFQLRYKRWVNISRAAVESFSKGKVGYIHIRGMNDASYRVAYEELLGRNMDKEAIIIDTRFNGGGWLHEDLATLLSGVQYLEFAPRDQRLGTEPLNKWSRPSTVLMSEGNYSDAHMFPYAYKAKNIGKLVGMPVAGTATAVWWERQIDPSLVFGIPQVGMMAPDGSYLENTQLEPDVKVNNNYEYMLRREDQQLLKAIEVLIGTDLKGTIETE